MHKSYRLLLMIIIAFIDLFSTLYVLFCIVFLFFFYLLPETNFRLKQQLSHFTADREISKKMYLNIKCGTYPSDFYGEPFQCLWLNVTPSQVTTSGHSENARGKCALFFPLFFVSFLSIQPNKSCHILLYFPHCIFRFTTN